MIYGCVSCKVPILLNKNLQWFCCSICGTFYCQSCKKKHCFICHSDSIFKGQFFEPKGIYRLPPIIRKINNKKERLLKVESEWQNGFLSEGEYKKLLQIIEELENVR